MNENTFKFLTDRGLEQYDAYINATYAKKSEAGDSVFVKANFTSVGNEYIVILSFDTKPGPAWRILINCTDNDEIEITSYSLINCSDSNGQLISVNYDSSNDSLLIEVNSQEYESNTNETIRINEFFYKYNGKIRSELTTGVIAEGDWSKIVKLGTLDIDSTQASEYMNSGKVPMSIVEIDSYKTPIYCIVAFEEEAYFEFSLDFNFSNRMICILIDNELYLIEVKNEDAPTEDVEFLKNITYQELKDLRDSGQLIPGMQYRITDYECTTSNPNTQGANHPFDIIVTADSEDTLNENARAINRDGYSYFDNSNLKAWEIKYCLDNDKTRFAWAIDGIQPLPTLTTFLYWEDEEGNEYVYTGYDASDPAYIEWWDENAPAAEEEEIPRRGVRASSPHVFTGPVASYNEAVYDSNELNSKVGKIKQMKVPEQPSKAFLTWRYIDDYGKEQYSTFYECKIVDKEGYIVWFKGDHPKYGEVFTTKNPLKYYGKDIPDSLVYEAKDLKTKIGEITGYSLPSNKKGTIEWKDGEEKTRTYNSYYTYTTSESKSVIAWTGENVEDEDDLGPNTIYTYNPPTDYSEQDPEASGYIYSSDSLDDRSRLRAPSSIGIITEFELIDNAEDTRSLRETAEPAEPIEPTEPTYITGKGVIYYMKDEFGNECPYDFKNIQYYVNEKWVYTFDEGGKDYSLVGKCFNNIIKEYKTNDGLTLDFNFILFTGVCYSNEFCFGCNTISISSECASNRFYEGCNYITLGKGCTFNTFEKSCKSIKLDSSNSYIHAFEGVSNISTPNGVYNAQIYPFTHITNGITILDKNNTKQVQFVGMNVKCDSGQIADGWPYRIRYTIEKYTGIDLILKPPKPCAYYSCEKLDSLTILTGSDNMDNFKVEFTVPERGCNISLPSGSTYIGSLSVTAGKRYLLTHDDYGMYYIGEINIA